jgi:hypothetical protein
MGVRRVCPITFLTIVGYAQTARQLTVLKGNNETPDCLCLASVTENIHSPALHIQHFSLRRNRLVARQVPDNDAPVVESTVKCRNGNSLIEAVSEAVIGIHENTAHRPGGNAGGSKMHPIGGT